MTMANKPNVILIAIALLLVIGMSFSAFNWKYENALGQVCFNVSPSVTMYGKDTAPGNYYGILNISLANNATVFNGSYMGFYPGTSTAIDVFNFANSSTNEYFVIPVIKTINASGTDRYCIYTGDASMNNVAAIAPYGMGFDTSVGVLTSVGAASTLTWNGTYATFTSSGMAGYHSSTVGTGAGTNTLTIGKMKFLNSTGSGGIYSSGFYDISTLWGQLGGVGLFNGSMYGGWYNYSGPVKHLAPFNSNYNIYMVRGDRYAPMYINDSMFDINMTLINGSSFITPTFGAGEASHDYLMYVNNSSVSYDWVVAGYYPPGEKLTTSSVVYDAQDPNIHFVNPDWGSSYSINDPALLSIDFSQAYDSCNISFNGALYDGPFVPTTGVNHFTDIDMGSGVTGDNNLTVTCDLGGVISHRYDYIVRSGANVDTIFTRAFGYTPDAANCSSAAQVELSRCYEGYNITDQVKFSAVICPLLNLSVPDYSCLNAGNVTKDSTLIFYKPTTFGYPGLNGEPRFSTEHVGANFIYYGAHLYPTIEILGGSNGTTGVFVYLPSQVQPRDCNVYYLNNVSGTCSWSGGFILNTGTVFIADKNNNWFTAGGAGVTNFDTNVSNTTAPTSVYSIIPTTPDLFANGIYTRLNCFVQNNTFKIRITNTVLQNYSIYILGNYSIINNVTEAFSYTRDVPLSGVYQVKMYNNTGGELCEYDGSTRLLLPFQMPNIMPAGFQIITWAMIIFLTVLTSIVPFAAVILILWNDIYQILNISQISIICMLSILFGFVNASFNMERGIKHMLIILGITTAYLAAIHPYAQQVGIDIVGFDSVMLSFTAITASNDIGSFVLNIPGFVINLFILLLSLPVTFMSFVMSMLHVISPSLWTASASIAPFVTVGFVLYFYLKAYEVLSNRFRPV
jgi:hypothetical protein